MNSSKNRPDRGAQGRYEEGFRQSRNPLQKDVPIGKQRPHGAHDDRTLTHNHLLDLGHESLNLLDVLDQVRFGEVGL